ncbi:glycosyltransferase [Salinimicrobium xinjiangense]|uniref:glycosyltransferase n=1 Tax=Salinimicrobium xinjiangense TaxID=438596 RepID=UPI000421D467|nr:glycosyltransferase family 2 protein [Salinimicrobium xinjiangense]
MKFYIVIPAHNEADLISLTLDSLVNQTLLPKRLVVVDDQSNDETGEIIKKFASAYPWISLVKTTSSQAHLPGSKVVNAFQKGRDQLDEDYDIICKFDADLIFPKHYLETIAGEFSKDPKVGLCGGFCHILSKEKWVVEDLTDKDHIRGALKAYRKECFKAIGGLRPSMGWDTVDELLALFHGWKIRTIPSLIVKHLRPTGSTYNKAAKLKQGEAFYKLRYGFIITLIASAKLAAKKKNLGLMRDYVQGYFNAKHQKIPFLVNQKEGAFIRRLRYRKMLEKLF